MVVPLAGLRDTLILGTPKGVLTPRRHGGVTMRDPARCHTARHITPICRVYVPTGGRRPSPIAVRPLHAPVADVEGAAHGDTQRTHDPARSKSPSWTYATPWHARALVFRRRGQLCEPLLHTHLCIQLCLVGRCMQ